MLAAGRPAGKAAGKEEGSQAEDMPSGGDAAQTPGLPRCGAGTCVATVAGSVTVELSDGSPGIGFNYGVGDTNRDFGFTCFKVDTYDD